MKRHDDSFEPSQRSAVDEIVRTEYRIIERTARYWVRSIERIQSGDLRLEAWLLAHVRYVSETCRDTKALARSFLTFTLRGDV